MDNKEVLLLKKALERQKKARIQAEKILEEKAKKLYETTSQLQESNTRLEKLLSEKIKALDGIFSNILDPYIVVDLHMNIIEMNTAAKDFLGYNIEKEKVNLSVLIPPEYIDYNVQAMQQLREHGVLKNYESKIILKDKSERFVHLNGSLVYDENRVPIAAQGILRDITEETEIKNLLAEQKKELDIIVENSPLGIVLKQSGVIITTNKTFQTLLGYTEDELKNRLVDDISIFDDIDKSNELNSKMEAGLLDNFTVVKKYIRKDGTKLWAKTSVNAFKDICGNVKYQVAMIEDITAQHDLELEREQLLQDLEASNKGLQEYAHIVSHDLKSPLRSISALSTWLYEDYKDVLDEGGVSQLSMMQEKVEAMDKLIDGILKYSTVSSEAIDNAEVDLNEVIKDITDIIYIPDHVEVKIVKTLPTVFADKTKMHQLFQNFLSNAVVHIERAVGIVNIDYEETATHWQFSVEDNGVGIPKEYHERIFKIFQSVGNKERSTGIGLSIVKKIIELYEGLVWLESSPEKGTTFYFTIKK